MQPDQSEATRKWYSKGRWAIAMAIIGIIIIIFVAATGGEYGAWLLWIAIPFLMISLAYFFIINAIRYFLT
ncbi:MAG: hypothetical protein A3K60_02615 [Euryarchaeota archaeon RBG_19FT_COMBO_56_21]|nr:MAG: hypothetical protein A3K60_02615 [Euryarchaeota archaeon RBG_19FT_COMBO_56_21]